jgi:hypothetical protein
MDISITYADGMVRIQNLGYTSSSDQIDISAAPGTFIMEVSRAIPTNAPLDSITIWHQSGRRVCSFAASEISTPSGADVDTLIPLIDAILTQSSGGTSVAPINTIFVSAANGTPTGNGAINDPIDTIAAGILLAEAASLDDGTQGEVRILPGTYDEQIIQSAGAPNVLFYLTSGATVSYSGLGATVSDFDNSISLYMEQGSYLVNTGGGSIVDAQANTVDINGYGTLQIESNYAGVEVSNTGTCNLRGIAITNISGSIVEAVLQTDGTLRMFDCLVFHDPSVAPIQKNGGDMKLYNTNIFAPNAAAYADAATAQDIQIVFCQSNVPAGVNVNDTVQAMNADVAFTI